MSSVLLSQESRWWKAEPDDLARATIEAFEHLEEHGYERRSAVVDAYCLYGDRSALDGYGAGGQWDETAGRHRLSRNVIASAVDTVLSEVTQTKPRPMFVTIGGGWLDQQRARKLTYYCDAKFRAVDMQGIAEQVVRDAVVAGLGILRPYVHPLYKTVLCDRIAPWHFFPDDKHCVSNLPRTYYVRHIVDKAQLAEMFPEHRQEIELSDPPDRQQWYYHAYRTQEVVEVIEAVHLPSGPETGDGRHVLCIKEAVLMDAEYEHQDPPFAFCRAVKPVKGFWGESLVSRAESTQTELNKLLRRIQDSMHLHARPLIFVQRGSNIVKSHINNRLGNIVEYSGNVPPTFMTPPSMSPEVYRQVDQLKAEIYNLMGVSELSAESLKPRGLNSGRALQVYNDSQSRRFVGLERGYEELFTTAAKLITRLERELAEENPSHEVVYERKGAGRGVKVPWRELDLDEESYRVQVFPASAFPTNPAAKIEMLEGMLERGVIDQQSFYELVFDVPDLESVRNRIVAPLEVIRKRLDMILETGEMVTPEPDMDLETAIRECQLAIAEAEVEDAPADRIAMLREFLEHAKHLMDQAARPAAPMPAGPPMDPLAAGPPPGMPPEAPPGMLPDMPPGLPPDGMPPGTLN